jgi:hypothetical protein
MLCTPRPALSNPTTTHHASPSRLREIRTRACVLHGAAQGDDEFLRIVGGQDVKLLLIEPHVDACVRPIKKADENLDRNAGLGFDRDKRLFHSAPAAMSPR